MAFITTTVATSHTIPLEEGEVCQIELHLTKLGKTEISWMTADGPGSLVLIHNKDVSKII